MRRRSRSKPMASSFFERPHAKSDVVGSSERAHQVLCLFGHPLPDFQKLALGPAFFRIVRRDVALRKADPALAVGGASEACRDEARVRISALNIPRSRS